MIKILLVDDSSSKASEIRSFIDSISDRYENQVSVASDYINAKKLMQKNLFDLLILDLQLPKRFGDTPDPDGGKNLLSELYKRESKSLNKPKYIIGVTSYKESALKHNEFFKKHLAFIFDYNDKMWRSSLEELFFYVDSSNRGNLINIEPQRKVDVAMITALNDPELEMIRKTSIDWEPLKIKNDPARYFIGKLKTEKGEVHVLCVSASEMGMSASSALTSKVVSVFNPKLIMMAGICGAIKGKAELGDLIVADPVHDYNLGKIIETDDGEKSFEPDVRQLRVKENIITNLIELNEDRYFFTDLKHKFNGEKPSNEPKIIIAPVGSGASVVANEDFANEIAKNGVRKLTGIEMEVYGVYYAAQKTNIEETHVVAIKAVCDFANKVKEDKYQKFCAFLSANTCLEYIKRFFYP